MAQQQNPQQKEQTPRRRTGLSKNYRLPGDFKSPWFLSMTPSDRRAFMVAQAAGEVRAKNASKRDAETYAENAQNRNVGRATASNASVAV